MKNEDNFLFRNFNKAKKFYDALSPNYEVWRELIVPGGRSEESGWIFRGQSNVDWPLLPSAWRVEGRRFLQPLRDRFAVRARAAVYRQVGTWSDPRRPNKVSPAPEDNSDRFNRLVCLVAGAMAEVEAIQQYARITDELGLHIRGLDDGDLLDYIDAYPWDLFLEQAPKDCRFPNYAQALAQHHGVPTRLLDWTMSARKAAFFAANDAVKDLKERKGSKGDRLVVFALSRAFLGETPGVHRFSVPREQFQFVSAQEGLFLNIKGEGLRLWNGNSYWPDVEHLLKAGNRSAVVRLTLPVTEADKLLELLYYERITEASLKPTYENIKYQMIQEWELGLPKRTT